MFKNTSIRYANVFKFVIYVHALPNRIILQRYIATILSNVRKITQHNHPYLKCIADNVKRLRGFGWSQRYTLCEAKTHYNWYYYKYNSGSLL